MTQGESAAARSWRSVSKGEEMNDSCVDRPVGLDAPEKPMQNGRAGRRPIVFLVTVVVAQVSWLGALIYATLRLL
jgi:hypothetical protein